MRRWMGASAGVGLALTMAVLFARPAGRAVWLAAAWASAAAFGCAGLARSRGREAAELAGRLADAAESSGIRRAFRYGEELYRELFEHNPAAVYRSTVDGHLLDCNEAMVRLFGYPGRGSFLAQPAAALFWDPGERDRLIQRLFEEEVLRNVEVRFRKRNGELFWGLKNEGLLRSPEGLPTAIEGTLLDITERKRAEEALAAERERAEEALRQSEAAVRSLHEIAGSQDLSFREKVRSLLNLGSEVFGMELAALHQVEGDMCVVVEVKSPGNFLMRGDRVEMHHTFYPAVRAVGRSLSFIRVEDAPEVSGCRVLPVESYLGGLVLVEGRPWGLLSFASQRPRQVAFRTSDTDLLELMVLWLGRELERDQRDGEMALVREMGDLLQSCKTVREACQVISRQAVRLFPGTSGMVYRVDPAHRELQALVAWGQSVLEEDPLPMESCWACRRDEEHFVADPATGLTCGHLPGLPPASSICVPMTAQMAAHGEAGVLHLRLDPGEDGALLNERRRRLAGIVAKHLAMALSNLALLERLHEQSIRDPLTGLYNRRHFEKTLRDEVRRADRSGNPLAVIMIDVDHFKRINDTFEHEGGDAVLQGLGETLARSCRDGDVPCRLGGEELALLLPGASLEAACQRAEELREEVRALRVAHAGRTIHSITISAGVAVYPDHGDKNGDGNEVVRLADQAMYRSKETGRDRVSVAPLPLRRRRGEAMEFLLDETPC
jgi:diguanylate cyclase (GGDEF)-like protein/PAS domain S-box-containing protein